MKAKERAVTYEPAPYRAAADETVKCPSCERMNDTDASYCDQCDTKLVGRDDVTIDGDVTADYAPDPYDQKDDEDVQCAACSLMNDDDAHFCDQCGEKLEDNPEVIVVENAPAVSDEEDDDPARSRNRSLKAKTSANDVAPKENLIRTMAGRGVELRDLGSDDQPTDGTLMYGHFSVFNEWYEISSFWEGDFLERTVPGAFADTIRDDISSMRVLFDHGFDPTLGNKPLGPIRALEEDQIGPYYEVPLLATDYNRDFVLPALRGQLMSGEMVGSLLGASFRFIVTGESWDMKPLPSANNPHGLPQRTITAVEVMEFGPVTFPANPAAGAGVRSRTDDLIAHLNSDPLFVARFTARHGVTAVERMLEAAHPIRGARHGNQKDASSLRQANAKQIEHLRRRARAALVL
jgi:phage head maturation protease